MRDSSSLFLQHLDRLGTNWAKVRTHERLELTVAWFGGQSGQTTTVSQEVASNVLIQRTMNELMQWMGSLGAVEAAWLPRYSLADDGFGGEFGVCLQRHAPEVV